MKNITYFLFGGNAVDIYQDKGLEALIQADENNQMGMYSTFDFIEGKTTPQELLAAFVGYDDYCIINKEEFEQL